MSLKDWLWSKKEDEPEKRPQSEPEPANPQSAATIPNVPVMLEDITRGMQHAATAANEFIAHQYMQALDPFFEPTEDGQLAPRTVRMQLDEKHHFEMPLVALATPRGLMLEKMKVHLTVRTEGVEQTSVSEGTDTNDVSRFHVSLSPASNTKGGRDSRHVDIEMQFTVLEPPESVMRLIDEYTNKIIPRLSEEEPSS